MELTDEETPAVDLERFVQAQDRGSTYQRALNEIRSGRKRTHWMWFVFPQLQGLGRSPTARRFALASLDEAAAYLAHPVLGPRLLDGARTVLATVERTGRSAAEIVGPLDAMKLRSSMTLFAEAAPEEQALVQVLERCFDGRPDPATLRLLGRG